MQHQANPQPALILTGWVLEQARDKARRLAARIVQALGAVLITSAMVGSLHAQEPLSPAFAVQEQCAEAPVHVMAPSAKAWRLACEAANHALQLLGRCEISLRKPLHVQIMSEVRHPLGGVIFGLFDPKQERVLVSQETNMPSLIEGTPYAVLPQRDFYRSLIVHEVVHGVMHQNLKRQAASHAAYEYPAYALQIESLAANLRDQFLAAFDQTAIKAISTPFNDPVLFFDPYFFAARAYHHFKAAADGCAHLVALLEGDVSFIVPAR